MVEVAIFKKMNISGLVKLKKAKCCPFLRVDLSCAFDDSMKSGTGKRTGIAIIQEWKNSNSSCN